MPIVINGNTITKVFVNGVQMNSVVFNGTQVFSGQTLTTRTYDNTKTHNRYGLSPSEPAFQRSASTWNSNFAKFSGSAVEAMGETFYYAVKIPFYWQSNNYSITALKVKLSATVDGVLREIVFPNMTKAAGRTHFWYQQSVQSPYWLGNATDINVSVMYSCSDSYNGLYTMQSGASSTWQTATLQMKNYQ